jgi:hypothetical protein
MDIDTKWWTGSERLAPDEEQGSSSAEDHEKNGFVRKESQGEGWTG